MAIKVKNSEFVIKTRQDVKKHVRNPMFRPSGSNPKTFLKGAPSNGVFDKVHKDLGIRGSGKYPD